MFNPHHGHHLHQRPRRKKAMRALRDGGAARIEERLFIINLKL